MDFTRIFSSSFSFFSTITRRRHDVFLSFRGEDTRYNITPKIHRALQEAGIPTFKDDINLQKGGEIATELLKAIQMSRIAIIVFSKNYATSVMSSSRQIVMEKHFINMKNVLGWKTWRGTRWTGGGKLWLKQASCTTHGWDMQNVASWHQSKFIKEIMKHILSRRQDTHMCASIFPPRIEAAKEYLNLLLSVISDDVLIVGIWGMDKTNVAKSIYNQNLERFEASCFLSDVNVIAEQTDGLLTLQKQFLSDILMEDNIDISSIKTGTNMIKNALRTKRVLAVLDNVNKLDQLNALARNRNWFGSGSRIIITTTDSHLLNVLEVDDVYGSQGIQVLEEQFQKNLETINALKEHIQIIHAQAHEREKSLMAEIERELNSFQGDQSEKSLMEEIESELNTFQGHDREKFLMAQIGSELNTFQAQLTLNLQLSLDQSAPPSLHGFDDSSTMSNSEMRL
ncbi:putative Disease resistance protein family [Quillaja saponaria]|uniref:Disease resistance protein family n=2 Tax=Quillaja saponaria TaxID=32244 RepID=A0AAD7L381_QUISA|nr:putative Disease resistance protein family [Quillaja saponaria]